MIRTGDQFSTVSRVTTVIAGFIAFTIILLAPSGYYYVSLRHIENTMRYENEFLASSISGIVSDNPDTWHFEEIRVSEILHRRILLDDEPVNCMVAVRDLRGMVVAEAVVELPSPVIVRIGTIFDAGVPAARIENTHSLRPLLLRTSKVALLATFLGGMVFVVLRLIPMRAVSQAYQALAMSERRYRYYFENSEVGIFEVEAAGWTFVTVNPKFEKIMGLPACQILGLSILDFLAEPKHVELVKGVSADEHLLQNVELALQMTDGRQKTILATLKLDADSGRIEGTAFDISDIKVLEQKLEEEHSRMVHAGRLASLGEMATGIAHEINQPLAIISLAMQYLEIAAFKDIHDPVVLESIEKVKVQVGRASTIIKNMRAFARGESSAKRQLSDVALVIDTALTYFREQFRVNNIALDTSLGSGLPQAFIDPQKFEQVIVNLLSNARYTVQKKFKQAGGVEPMQVSVSLSHNQERQALIVEVADNGIGMDETGCKRCFDPFYTTKEVGQGTGIGLSISYTIVKEFGGTIEVASERGKGCIFRICLPLEGAPGPERVGG